MTLVAPAPLFTGWDDPIARAARVQSALATSSRQRAAGTAAAGDVRNLSGVGGDFVDVLRVEDHLIAVLGDVSGKGVSASLVAAMALGSLQHHVQDIGPHPAQILRAVSSSMGGALERTSSIITLAIVAVDSRAGLVRLVSAGHHPILRIHGGRVRHVAATCPPIGVDAADDVERAWERATGSALVVVSDGVIDQEDPHGTPLGLAGLAAALRSTPAADPSTLVARTFDAVEDHAGWMPAADDRAVLAIVA